MADFDTYVNVLREISEDIKSGNHDNDERHIETLKHINEDFIGELNDHLAMTDKERLVIHRLMNYICSLVSDTHSQLTMALGHYSALEGMYLQFFPPEEEQEKQEDQEEKNV